MKRRAEGLKTRPGSPSFGVNADYTKALDLVKMTFLLTS